MKRLIISDYKNKSRLICLALGFIFTILLHLTQCSLDDWLLIAKPLSQRQFLYSLLKDDYQNRTVKSHSFLQNPPAYLSDYAIGRLEDALLFMNPDYSPQENIYGIDFDQLDEEQLVENVESYGRLLFRNYQYYHVNWDFYYDNYCLFSPFFAREMESDKNLLIGYSIQKLKYSIDNGYYNYNFLFGFNTKLTEEEKNYVRAIIEWLESIPDDDPDWKLSKCYAAFVTIDEYLGGNTGFELKRNISYTHGSLENALENYEYIEKHEGIGFAYARLIADYMGICAGLMPILLSAFAFDFKGRKGNEMIMSKGVGSGKLVCSKVLGVIIPYCVLFLGICVYDTIVFNCAEIKAGGATNYYACFFYFFFWLLPTLMIAAALPLFLSVLFNNGMIAAFLSVLGMFWSLANRSEVYYFFQPVIRFNEFGKTERFFELLPQIAFNRVFIIISSIILMFFTVHVLEYRRRHFC